MKFWIVSALIAFTQVQAASAAGPLLRLDHSFGSIYADVRSLCTRNGSFHFTSEKITICREQSKSGHCTNRVEVVPARAIVSQERVCLKKNPAKGGTPACLKFGTRTVVLPTTYTFTEMGGDYKHPVLVKVTFTVPACSF